MSERIKPGDIVQHFKRETLTDAERDTNKYLYKVLDFAEHTGSVSLLIRSEANEEAI